MSKMMCKTLSSSQSIDIGDGSFEFVENIENRILLQNAYTALSMTDGGWEYAKEDPGEGGFIWSENPIKSEIMKNMDKCTPEVGHSGASFGCIMRHMQFIANNGIHQYELQGKNN